MKTGDGVTEDWERRHRAAGLTDGDHSHVPRAIHTRWWVVGATQNTHTGTHTHTQHTHTDTHGFTHRSVSIGAKNVPER